VLNVRFGVNQLAVKLFMDQGISGIDLFTLSPGQHNSLPKTQLIRSLQRKP